MLGIAAVPEAKVIHAMGSATFASALVWIVDPRARTVEVFTSPTASTLLHETDTLTGDPVLSGFTLALRELFAELDPH
jgi:Uma2 family endonuclease